MKRAKWMLVFTALLISSVGQVKAGYTLVTNRSALNGNDSVNWGPLGPTGTQISNPFSINSSAGVTLNVSDAIGSYFERRDQSNGWAGNFALGDKLLWTQGFNGPEKISLSIGLSAIGTQIQADLYGGYTATITAYDSANNVLASFSEFGNSTSNADNSAIFLGIRSDTNDIYSIKYSIAGYQDFAINKLEFDTRGSAIATPAPSSFALTGIALGMFGGFFGLRRLRKPAAISAMTA